MKHIDNTAKERSHWKLKKALVTRGTLSNSIANASNPDLNHHVTSRREYTSRWKDFLDNMYDKDENLPALPQQMEWIDLVDLEEHKEFAETIDIGQDDIERTFDRLKGKTSKSPGPNNLNYYIIKLAWQSNPEYFLALVQHEINSFESPQEWSKVNMRPIYKGKGDKQDPNA